MLNNKFVKTAILQLGKWGGVFCHNKIKFIIDYFCGLYRAGFRGSKLKSVNTGAQFRKGIKLVGEQYISIGADSIIGAHTILTAWDKMKFESAEGNGYQYFHPQIEIGNRCNIGMMSHITAINSIKMGNDVLIGPQVLISDNSHGQFVFDQLKIAPSRRPLFSKGAVVIEDNVWIGQGAMILAGVTIGKGSIIAANSVVTKSIPPYSLAAGSPATIINHIDC